MTKILPPTYFFAAIALMIALNFLFPVAALIPFSWRFVGLVPFCSN